MTKSARNIFKDESLYQAFEEQGYVILDLLNDQDLLELEGVFKTYFPETPEAFFSSSYLPDFDLKKEISQKIEAVILPKLSEYFDEFRCIGAAFLSKAPDKYSELPMHQDWTIVDESTFLAANIWTPISKITENNGTLQVLPGSHKTFRALRAPTLPFSGNHLRDKILPHLKPLYVKPGQTVVLDQALVHYSDQNLSQKTRIAFTTGVISKNAPLHFHYWDKDSKILEKFAMDDDFLFRWQTFHEDIFKRPTFGESIEKFAFEPELFDEERLHQTIGNATSQKAENIAESAPKRKSLIQRLFGR